MIFLYQKYFLSKIYTVCHKLNTINDDLGLAILIAEKRSSINTANAIKFIDLLNSLPIYTRELSFSIGEIINVAGTNKLASEDTTYLILAMHEGLPMVTNDKALIKAYHHNSVPLLKA
ncbi:MAG: type II toxin-antitoxin system VapC family toxin [Rickettsia endosymbiont of Pentastiridius leporinus]